MSFWLFWLLLAAMAVLLCVSNVLMVCASVSVGQLFRTHRIPAAIGAYVVFYMVQQVLSEMDAVDTGSVCVKYPWLAYMVL